MGWLWQLRRSPLDEAARTRAFDSLERNVQLQVQLISDLLDVSRISKGKLVLELRWIDIRDVMRDALDSVSDHATRQGVELTSAVEPAMLIADQGRLLQIVGNLLTNAIQFTPSGGRVTVTYANDGSDGVLCVRDTGAGIDKAFLPNVFDQFRQGGGGLTRKHGGLGLGLAVVRQLTELHGGAITVASDGPGLGAMFEVRLPRESGSPDGASATGTLPLKNLQVVLAGTPEEETLRTTCEAAGATVTVAGDGLTPESHVRTAGFDVLITSERRWTANDSALAQAFAARQSGAALMLLTSAAEPPANVVRRVARALASEPR
jgi:two-component sensor histidine kinase